MYEASYNVQTFSIWGIPDNVQLPKYFVYSNTPVYVRDPLEFAKKLIDGFTTVQAPDFPIELVYGYGGKLYRPIIFPSFPRAELH